MPASFFQIMIFRLSMLIALSMLISDEGSKVQGWGFWVQRFKGSEVKSSSFRLRHGGLNPYMKLQIVGTANRRISNIEPQNVEG